MLELQSRKETLLLSQKRSHFVLQKSIERLNGVTMTTTVRSPDYHLESRTSVRHGYDRSKGINRVLHWVASGDDEA